ncbi:unnamed protein product [Caenorhabditis auriculariae]|uniref:Uncharacterized protein n=1 Tax=Caenorhabditis auriculariae TaxID=2777116 RepID=A0A8S1HNQ8_9PELO|nr:unnamed protein product [Caenorhabditis auriculariae]
MGFSVTLRIQFASEKDRHSGRISPIKSYIGKYNPTVIPNGDHISRQYPKYKMEVTLSFGMNEEMTRVVETAIEEHFTNDDLHINDLEGIGEAVERLLGGYWSVSIFSDPYEFANTAFKRSPSFIVLDVNGSGVAVVKEASN